LRVAIDRCIESYNARLSAGEPPMNQVRLARALGLDQSTISRWQSGERAISLYWATRIAEILSCSVDDLLHLPEVCQPGISERASNASDTREKSKAEGQLAEEGTG
jgi:transcriptional regulator with XRE-family HTH domain